MRFLNYFIKLFYNVIFDPYGKCFISVLAFKFGAFADLKFFIHIITSVDYYHFIFHITANVTYISYFGTAIRNLIFFPSSENILSCSVTRFSEKSSLCRS